MSELFWPGDARAGSLLTDAALLAAMTRVEVAWLTALQAAGVAADVEPTAVPLLDPEDIAAGVEAGGNPVIPLVAQLRGRLDGPTAHWLHRGLTSQDVLDTALVLCLRDVLDQVLRDAERQVTVLGRLADQHRHSVQAGRTLTQHAVPTSFGLTAANWLTGVLDAAVELVELRAALPAQVGGAAGTRAALVSLTGDPDAVVARFTAELGLRNVPPWHGNRRTITRLGDALVATVDAQGRIANDVLLRARPEIGELAEPRPGGSSTMPHKQNPVLSVLVRRAAIAAPFLAAQLHAAAAAAVDERPDGAWHVEWAALRALGRLVAVAAAQTADLLEGLDVAADRMRATAEAAATDLLAEQRAMTGESGALDGYLGATDALIDQALERADAFADRIAGSRR